MHDLLGVGLPPAQVADLRQAIRLTLNSTTVVSHQIIACFQNDQTVHI